MVFHDRSLGSLLGENSGDISDVDVGDTLFIAWLDHGVIRSESFEITEITYDMGPDFKLSDGSQERCLVGGLPVFMLVDVDSLERRFEAGHPEHLVLGVSTSADGLVLEIILTLTSMGYSPTEAVDYAVPKFGVSLPVWSLLRGEDVDEIVARGERVQKQLDRFPGAW